MTTIGRIGKALCLGAAAFTAFAAGADQTTNYWSRAGGGNWDVSSNWINDSGTQAEFYPKGAGFTAGFTNNTSKTVWEITSPDATEMTFGSIFGDWRYRFSSKVQPSNGVKARTWTFGDTSDFEGAWTSSALLWGLTYSGAVANPSLSQLYIDYRPTITVPAGTTVTVHEIVGQTGHLIKNGDGELKLNDVRNAENKIASVTAGTLTLEGTQDDPSTWRPAGDPLFWVDASATNRMDFREGDFDRTYVTRMYDVRDDHNTIYASRMSNDNLGYPFLVKNAVGGRTVLDFGTLNDKSEAAVYGAGASMSYSLERNIVDVIFVVREHELGTTFFIGQTSDYNFHRGYNSEAGILVAGDANTDKVTQGRIFLDQNATDRYAKPTAGVPHIIEYVLTEDGLRPSTFANDRSNIRYGGMQLAEALFYTNRLSFAERARTMSYLKRKWNLFRTDDTDLSVLRMTTASAAVSVPEGRTAKVRQVAVSSGAKLVKTGSGTLKVGRFQPAATAVEVQSGVVKFDKDFAQVADDAPAADAHIWLDATKTSSFEYADVSGPTNCISKWKDCRDGKTGYASPGSGFPYPFLNEGACDGDDVVDFGGFDGNTNNTYMCIDGYPNYQECFELVRVTGNANLFGCNSQELLRASGNDVSCPLSTSYAYMKPAAGIWTIDGETIDPREKYAIDPDTYYVVSYASASAAPSWKLGAERNTYGRVQLGEFIGYQRVLTDTERRQTVAYLLKKWKNRTTAYNSAAPALKSIGFSADNADPVLDSDADMQVEAVTAAGGSLRKTGAGTVDVKSEFDVRVMKVEEGALVVTNSAFALSDAAFHVDATRTDTITYRAGQEAAKRVARWYDCSGNGRYAAFQAEGKSKTNAVYCTDGETYALPSGTPYVDFGTGNDADAAGMRWYNASGEISALDICEMHIVYSVKAKGNYPVVGGPLDTVANGMIESGNNWDMFWNDCTNARDAWKRTDQEAWRTSNYYLASGSALSATQFYVTSVVLKNGLTMRGDSFAMDRAASCGAGGIRLCEAIIFTGKTNTTERTDMIHDYLLKKWKNVGDGPKYRSPSSFTVANGATLKLGGTAASRIPNVTSLGGDGTIEMPSVTGVAQLNVAADAEGHISSTTVNGAVGFANAVTVQVTVADEKALVPGEYSILSASSFTNLDLHNFTLVSPQMEKRRLALIADGSTLKLRVSCPGMVLVVR